MYWTHEVEDEKQSYIAAVGLPPHFPQEAVCDMIVNLNEYDGPNDMFANYNIYYEA